MTAPHVRRPRGNECECVTCGRFFTGETAFQAHLLSKGCQDPAAVVHGKTGERRLVEKQRANGPTWGFPDDGRWTQDGAPAMPGERPMNGKEPRT